MKAYYSVKDRSVRLFRPDMNMKRLTRSGLSLGLPPFHETEFLKCIKELVRLDKDWLPTERGYSLYIRPTFIGTQPSLGVGISNSALLYCILSPVGPYYPTGFKPVSLLAETKAVRAWPGGCGDKKIGGNYGPTISVQAEAAKQGCSQVLWLTDKGLSEVGTMNLFVLLKTESKVDTQQLTVKVNPNW